MSDSSCLISRSLESNLPSCVVIAYRRTFSAKELRCGSSVSLSLHEGLVEHSTASLASRSHSRRMCIDKVRPCLSLIRPDLLFAGLHPVGAFRKHKILADVFGAHAVVDILPVGG